MAISHENGTVILHNAQPLLEIAHYYTVAELEYIEETVNILKMNGIESPLVIEPPESLSFILEQIEFYFTKFINLTRFCEYLVDDLTKIKGEIEFLSDERDYLKSKLHTNNPRKDHFYKTIKQMYSTEPETASCSICMTDNLKSNQLQLTNCGHIYCKECFNRNQEIIDTCAVCRSKCYGVF